MDSNSKVIKCLDKALDNNPHGHVWEKASIVYEFMKDYDEFNNDDFIANANDSVEHDRGTRRLYIYQVKGARATNTRNSSSSTSSRSSSSSSSLEDSTHVRTKIVEGIALCKRIFNDEGFIAGESAHPTSPKTLVQIITMLNISSDDIIMDVGHGQALLLCVLSRFSKYLLGTEMSEQTCFLILHQKLNRQSILLLNCVDNTERLMTIGLVCG